jgi:hypothetical protein
MRLASRRQRWMLRVLSAMASVNRRSENLQHRGAHSKAHKTWGAAVSARFLCCRTAWDLLVPGVAPEPGFHGGRDHPGSMCVVGAMLAANMRSAADLGDRSAEVLRFAARHPEGVRRADVRTRSVFLKWSA